MSGNEREADSEDWRVFERQLSALKQNGCAFLVAGSVPDVVVANSCRRAFGDDAAGPRHRLLVLTDASPGEADSRLPRAASPGSDTTVVDYASFSRSTAAVPQAGRSRSARTVTVESRQLSALGEAIVEAIASFDPADDGFEPGAVRVCFDSLVPIVCEFGRQATFQFLHLLVEYVRSVAGMAYVYLPEPRTSETVRLFESVFNGVIELRVEEGVAQQRWELRSTSTPTEWVRL